nr:unnamed protein product [Spirometra erinaceieuropaei]
MSSGTRNQSIDEPFSVGRPAKDYEGTGDLKPLQDEDKLGITLAAAVLPTSTPHYCVNPPSYSNLPLKLTAFDEKEDFSAWLRRSQFRVGVVPTDKQSMAILQCLTPNQLDRALDAGLSAETPISNLCQELEKLLKPTMSKTEALNQLYSRRRRIGETANEFADELYRLCKSAYPSISQTDCSDAVLYHFIKYIEPPELRRSLLLQPPRDLKEAIDRVNIYAKIPHNELSPQPSFRNSQAQNWRRYDTGSAYQRQKENFDAKIAGTPYQPDDLVLRFRPVPPVGVSAKFFHPWEGPFRVLRVISPTTYIIQDAAMPNSPFITAHFDKLKPFRGRLPLASEENLPILPDHLVPEPSNEITIQDSLPAILRDPADRAPS